MKTALQELIEDCQQNLSGIAVESQEHGLNGFEKQHYQSTAKCLRTIIQKCSELLDKEKEQIMDAYREGQIDEGYERKHKDATDYYQKTYNQ